MPSSPESRFSRFHVHTTYYKTIHRSHGSRRANPSLEPRLYYLQDKNPHKIAVHILIPRTLAPGPSPLFIKFHGGGLVAGDANYPPWWAHWLVPFVIRNNAIAVIPDYRLIPEHDGEEIMEDVRDFWEWVGGKGIGGRKRIVGSTKKENGVTNGTNGADEDWEDGGLEEEVHRLNWEVDIDWDRVCIDGDSAGGLLALQSVIHGTVQKLDDFGAANLEGSGWGSPLLEPIAKTQRHGEAKDRLNIRALILHYPMTTKLSRKPHRFGPHDTPTPKDDRVIDEHMAHVAPGTIISRSTPWMRFPLSYALSAFGRWLDYYGDNPELLPISAIDRFASDTEKWREHLPSMLFLHADKDTVVDVETTEGFCKKMRQLLGKKWVDNYVRLEIKGGEHGFDLGLGEEDNKWLRDAVKWVEDRWMGDEPVG